MSSEYIVLRVGPEFVTSPTCTMRPSRSAVAKRSRTAIPCSRSPFTVHEMGPTFFLNLVARRHEHGWRLFSMSRGTEEPLG